jgi:twitching motility protein PilI
VRVETSTVARLGSLQSFQQQLAQRLQHAQKSNRSAKSFLACATGRQRWLFDLTHTDEILGGEQPTPVPFTCDWYLGLVSHRGQLIGVIDLEGFAGADPKPWQQSDRLLALSSTLPVPCAIRVTQMIGVIDQAHLSPAHFNPKVPSATPPSWAPHSFTHSDGSHYFGVDLMMLMAQPSFLDIAQYPA